MYRTKLKTPLALATLLAGTGAWAGDFATVTQSEPVSYTRDELARGQGAMQLYARLDAAARKVCGDRTISLSEQSQWRQCHDDALDRAVGEVNDERLSALHHTRAGIPRRLIASTTKDAAGSGT